MRTVTAVLTNMVMIRNPKTGFVVAQQRIRGGWEGVTFPGGHVDPGETLYDAAIREVFEETGLTIRNPRICGVSHWIRESDDARNIVFQYIAEEFEGELLENSDEGRVFWVSIEELMKMELSRNFDSMLEVFLREDAQEAFAPWVGAFEAPMRVI